MAPLSSSASAPDLRSGRQVKDKAKLQNLLTKANASRIPQRCVGGAPRSVPASRASTTNGAEASRSPTGPLARSGAKASSSPRAGAGDMPAHTEHAGHYMRKLIGKDNSSNGPFDWRLVQELDAIDDLLQVDQARRQEVAQKHILRDQLMKQRDDAHRRNLHTDDENKMWGHKLRKDADAFYQEEALRREAEREFNDRFYKEQGRLLEATNRKRLAERQRDIEIEKQMCERNVVAKQIEVAKDEEKKRRQKEEAEKCQREREQAAEVKKEKKRQEAMRDVELMYMQQEKLDKQERERAEKFEQFAAAQRAKMAYFEAHTVNEVAEQAKRDEARMKSAVEQKSKKDFQEHQEKHLKAQKAKQETTQSIKAQLDEHAKKRVKEREEEAKMALEFKRDAEKAIDEEKKKVQDRREKAKEHANFLLSQMNDKSHLNGNPLCAGKFGHEQMSEVEKSINRDRIARASCNESLQLLFRNKQLQYRLAEKMTKQ